MKKRYFLQASAAMVATAWLSHYFTGRSKVMATAENEFEITKTNEEWRQILTPEQFRVLRKHETEAPGSSPLDKQYNKGTYACAACKLPLFTSQTKFNSHTGWPSFYEPVSGAIATTIDSNVATSAANPSACQSNFCHDSSTCDILS